MRMEGVVQEAPKYEKSVSRFLKLQKLSSLSVLVL